MYIYQNYGKHLQLDLATDFGYEITDETEMPLLDAIQKSIQQDYTRVEIYFQTLNVKSILQSALYPVSDFQKRRP